MSKSRPLSQLIYFPVQNGSGGAPIITLHDHTQFGKDVAEYGTAASPEGRVISLESYKGVFVGKEIVGYTWYLGPTDAPSPIFFGDSLSEIERFLWDEVDRSGSDTPELPFLLGIGQGGTMALATALAVPELISGVIAIDAYLPVVGGWDPPLAPMNNLPVLLINPRASDKSNVLSGERLVSQLKDWETDVSTITQNSVTPATLGVSTWIGKQEVKTLVP